jgi:hypothetical protein
MDSTEVMELKWKLYEANQSADNLRRIINDLHSLVETYQQALQLISSPVRPDGTYNRDRRACEILAFEALTGKKSN